jgi:multidrug efflux pump subunit AcrB/outer membrane protein TolC
MITPLLEALQRTRLVASLCALLLMMGLAAWSTMPRQEDPSFVPRFGTVVVPFPGADTLRVERLVLQPLADELATVDTLRQVDATARPGVAVLQLRLHDEVYDTEPAWDDVRRALADAALPAEAGPVRFDDDIGDPASVVLLVTGSADPLALRDGARQLELALRGVPGVSRVEWVADPGAEVRVTIDDGRARRMGLEPARLAALLQGRNQTLPGGTLSRDGRTVVLRPHTELHSVDELRATPVMLPGGAAVPLGELADVRLAPAEPAPARLLHDGQLAVGMSVVPQMPRDLVAFGDEVRAAVQGVDLAPLSVEVFADQPAQVADRLADLGGSLAMGVAIVAGVLFVVMGPRLGAVVSSVVPLVALSTMGVYAAGGGVLHQISVAALVLALGLLVDNAIVVAEAVQQGLDRGLSPDEAARDAVRQLATPLFTATGTTLAAFAPMLVSSGGTADFTRAIPVVVVLSLVLSYLAAVAVTPQMAAWLLRPSADQGSRLGPVAARIGLWVTTRPRTVVAGVAGLLLATAALLPLVEQQFFPLSDQARVVLSVELPEGTHVERTSEVVSELTADLAAVPSVAHTTAFVGRGPPRFYYNLNDVPSAPHAATVVLDVHPADDVPRVLQAARERARTTPEALVVAKRLQQGPPVGAPVELRLVGDDLDELADAARQAMELLRRAPGAVDVRTDLGVGVPQVAMAIDDVAAGRRGVGRADVALTLLGQTRGLSAGTFTNHWDDLPVAVRGSDGEALEPGQLDGLSVGGVPLGQLAHGELTWAPASVRHRDGVRQVRVLAELHDGATFGAVQRWAHPRLEALDLGTVRASWGGEAEGSGEANAALLGALPVGLGLLVFFLLVEFDSLRRAGLVLLTVPLAGVGVVPGLALSGAPFGFMSLLGVIALTGIVVNNAIVLIDRIDRAREEGMGVGDAVADAVRVRLRPILLTTATTVSGMVPLALSGSSLWPPLAWAMISGLLASTVLTVAVVPALYVWLFDGPVNSSRGPGWRRWPLLGLLLSTSAAAQPVQLTLDEVIEQAADAPVATAAAEGARAARHQGTAAWLSATGPAIGATLQTTQRDGPVEVDTPFGPLPQRPESQVDLAIEASVPLVQAAGWAEASAATRGAKAQQEAATWERQQRQRQAAELALDTTALSARLDAAQAYADALDELADAVGARRDAGLAVDADALRARAQLADARQQVLALTRQLDALAWQLGALLGRGEPVLLADLPDDAPGEVEASDELDRADVRAAQWQARAAAAQHASVGLQWVPEVELYGRALRSDNEALVDPSWLEGGLRATFTPLARGTRAPLLAARAAQRRQATEQAEAARYQAAADRAAADAALEVAIAAVPVRAQAAEQASEASEVLAQRYREGLASLTDALAASAEARAARAAVVGARVDLQRARLQVDWAAGRL